MKIIELYAENIKRIKVINIKPKGNAVIIEGPNTAGKTSTLDSIAMALGGKTLIPDNPIRNGQETAQIKVNLGDYIVTRHWTKSGTTHLKLENKDGMKATAPQQMLDALVGDLAFDPMEFCRMDKAKRVTLLKEIAKLDFTDLEKEYREKYDERRMLNRGIKELQIKVDGYGDIKDPGEIPTTNELELRLSNANEFNKKIKKALGNADQVGAAINSGIEEIKKKKDIILSMETDIEKIGKANVQFVKDAENYLSDSKEELINTAAICLQLDEIDNLVRQKDQFRRRQIHQDQLDGGTQSVNLISDRLQEIEDDKNKQISAAKLPVKGLDFLNGDISYNGIEFAQASSAEQIKVSMAIAMALNPKIRIVRIMNGSLLDKKAMAEIIEIAEVNDYQIWVEKVSDKPNANAIYIEDGCVVP